MMYWFGIVLAISSGVVNNLGLVFQKKVVNEVPLELRDERFMRTLLKNPLWLSGLLLQLVLGGLLFMIAQLYIGPALIPGLMAAGLIVLSLGSVKIIGETLQKLEIVGIILMISAIVLLGLSGLSIAIEDYNLLDFEFLLHVAIFTIILLIVALSCEFTQRTYEKHRGVLLAIESGCMFALSNFWVFPMMATVAHVFNLTFIPIELGIFIFASVFLVLANLYGISKIQNSFRIGQASLLVPIQQIPVQITPAFVYLTIFMLTPPTIYSIYFLIIAIILILVSSFLLAKRQSQLETIQ